MASPLDQLTIATSRYITKNKIKLIDNLLSSSPLLSMFSPRDEPEEDDFDKFVRETREAAGIETPAKIPEGSKRISCGSAYGSGGRSISENITYGTVKVDKSDKL